MIRSKGTIRPTALAGVLGAGLLAALIVCELGFCKEVPERTIDLSIPADQLPYELTSIGSSPPVAGFTESWDNTVDVNGDGFDERIYCFTRPTGLGNFFSAVVCYTDPPRDNEFDQFNGTFSTSRIWGAPSFLDINGTPGREIILTKPVADAILLEIIDWDSLSHPVASYIVAAVGKNLPRPGAWSAIHINPLAAIDLNGDGAKDLIFSRIAKPDSAFPRGIVAYDLAHDKMLWFFPLADMVTSPNFLVTRRPPDDSICFVFATTSNQNSYSANGMDSQHAYILSLNPDGTERWRKLIGLGGFNPSLAAYDADGDGIDEGCVGIDARMPESNGRTIIQAYDAFHGTVVGTSPQLDGAPVARMFAVRDSALRSTSVYATVHGDTVNCIYRFCAGLSVQAAARAKATAWSAADLNADGHPEIMCSSPRGKVVILDRDLRLLAWIPALGEPRAFKSKVATGVFASPGPGFDMLAFSKRSFAALLYARYKWFLAVVVAAILLVLVGRTIIWVSRLYLVAAGIPSLDKISAMVLVLDRKGRIVYANAHELVRDIFGTDLRRRQRYDSTKPPAHPSAVDLIRRSFDQPFSPTQGQFELAAGESNRRIELVIYPRLNRRNQVLGKIVVGEDITGQVGWQRKAVLGDAAQRWIHKLKGHLATARIYIDNVLEREANGTEAGSSTGLREDLNAVKAEVEKTTEAAARILRFATIGRPNRTECDINEIISLAVRPYLDRPFKGVSVVKMPHPEPLPAFVDHNQIGEILDNLLSNAVAAISTNGVITVSSRPAPDLPQCGNRGMAEIVVEDNGPGISRDDLPQLFTPGFTRTPGGTGIGLAIVREIVENHGGEVIVDSELGRGSRFIIRIPIDG